MRSIPRTLLIALFLSLSGIVYADAPPARTINTNGEAVVYVTPDEVILSFGVETFDKSLDKAKEENDKLSLTLVAAIKAVGVEKEHIQIDNLQIQIEYVGNRVSNGISGYIARRAYSVTLKNTKLFEKLVDSALKNGANQINGFDFRSSELRKHRDNARTLAIKAAKEKAILLAKDLECAVGKPMTISESSGGYWGGYNFRNGGNAFQNASQIAGNGGDDDSGAIMPLGQISIRSNVTVVFELTDK